MATPFYNQGDQDIYAGGDHFVPQEQYRLNYTPSQSLASTIGNTGGVTGAQAANPYIYPQGGEGGGGGFSNTNKYGLDLDTQKTVRVGMANAEGVYEPTPIEIAKSPGGIWKNKKTGQNVYHGNIGFKGMIGTVMDKVMGKKSIPGVPDEGSTTGAEWDEEFDPTITGKKLNTYQRWKAKKEFVAQQEKAAADQAAADQVRQNIQTYKITGRGGQGGNRPDTGINTPGGGKGQSPTGGNVEGTPFAQGGRIGLRPGGIVDAGKQYYGKEDWEIQQINRYGVSYPEFLQNQFGKGLHEMDASEISLAVKAWDSWRSSQAEGGRIGMAKGKIPIPKAKTKMGFLDKLFAGMGGISTLVKHPNLYQSMSKATGSGRAAKAAQLAKYGKWGTRGMGLLNPWTAVPYALLAGAQYGVGKAFDPYRDETGKIGAEGHAQLASAARAREALMAQRNTARQNRRDGGLAGIL